jgi:hypothetical protein
LSRKGSLSFHICSVVTCCDIGALGFSGLIWRTTPFNCLLRHAKGCWGPVLIRILMGPIQSPLTTWKVMLMTYSYQDPHMCPNSVSTLTKTVLEPCIHPDIGLFLNLAFTLTLDCFWPCIHPDIGLFLTFYSPWHWTVSDPAFALTLDCFWPCIHPDIGLFLTLHSPWH